MNKKLLDLSKFESMSSLEISKLTGKRHDNVLRDIREILDVLSKNSKLSSDEYQVVMAQNKMTKEIKLNYRLTIVLVTGYSHELRDIVVSRWLELEAEKLKAINDEKIRKEERDAARMEFRPMTNAIQQAHEKPMFYHFSNEADLINRIIFGKPSKQLKEDFAVKDDNLRDALTPVQIAAVRDLQQANTIFIESGFDFEKRKEMLSERVRKKWITKLVDELVLIES